MPTNRQQTGKKDIIYWIRKAGASVFFTGYFPVASGTVGSALTVGGLWFVMMKWGSFLSPERIMYYWIAMLSLTAVSIFLSSRANDVFGTSDPSQVVIDEVAGQFITFFMIPLSVRTLVLGFLLFRFFDIVKPFPVHVMEEMQDGVGITMDDVAAGVMANISMLIILGLYQWIRAYLY